MQTTQLASGKITNSNQLIVLLVEPTDGTPPLVRVH